MIPPIHLQPIPIQAASYGEPRGTTLGVVVHATRGRQLPGLELLSTLNWFRDPRSGVSAHAVVGRTGLYVRMLHPGWVAYHAREYNQAWLSLEFEQGFPTERFTDEQIIVGAYVVRAWAEEYGFAVNRSTIVGHDEIAPGKREGKTDPGPEFDWPRFLDLCEHPEHALDEKFQPYASPVFGDMLDVANSLLGIARLNDDQRAAGYALAQRLVEVLVAR